MLEFSMFSLSSVAPSTSALSNTLMVRFFPSLQNLSVFKFMALALLGTVFLTLSAKTSIPFYPVPTTMQTFAVITLACAYGARLATATVVLYLFEAFIGLPVLQGHSAGFVYMVGPTAGYLIGFISAAYVIGRLFEEGFGRTMSSAALLFILGAVIIDIPGLVWLSNLIGFEPTKAVYLSYQYAFLLKTGLGAVILPTLWHHHHSEKKDS